MGYTITIGQARVDYNEDFVSVEAETTTHPNAPDHCPYTKNSNSRSPSYTVWHEFCKATGVYELFYGSGWHADVLRYGPCGESFHREQPLLAEHPGAAPIGKADADYVSEKLAAYKLRHPTAEPGFWDWGEHTKWREVDNGKDPVLARLMWLDFWMRWAVENCSHPVLSNY